jgi:ATP-dependent RNA helicase RhlE
MMEEQVDPPSFSPNVGVLISSHIQYMNNFQELSLSAVLQMNLVQNKLTQPTPVQAQSIPAQLEGKDVVVTAQTGTGKTLAFVLPLLEQLIQQRTPGVNALILSPTRELASQIDQTFRMLARGTDIRSAVVTGGANEQRQLLALRQGAQVVIATPGRLQDFLKRKLVKLAPTRFLVLDEADRMLDMGFLPTIKEILAMLPTERQTMFFSATMEPSVAQLIRSYLKDPVRVEVGSTTKTADHVDLHLYEIDQDRKLALLQKMLKDEEGSFLVFARTKHGADRLAQKLINGGANATRIHGNRTQAQRNQALRGFQEGDYRVLVATDVAARGIHVDGIAHVVNFDLPQAPEDFIHRVGRTGRAGIRGTATTFCTRGERGEVGRIEKLLAMKLTRKTAPADLQREVKSFTQPAPQQHYGKPAHHEAAPVAKRVPFWQKPASASRFNKRKTSSKAR